MVVGIACDDWNSASELCACSLVSVFLDVVKATFANAYRTGRLLGL